MAGKVEESTLIFKLGVYAVAAMLVIPLLLLPLLTPLELRFLDGSAGRMAGQAAALFAFHSLVFVLFLRLANLLFCTSKGLVLLFAINGFLFSAMYAFTSWLGNDPTPVMYQVPLMIATTYLIYCRLRKLI